MLGELRDAEPCCYHLLMIAETNLLNLSKRTTRRRWRARTIVAAGVVLSLLAGQSSIGHADDGMAAIEEIASVADALTPAEFTGEPQAPLLTDSGLVVESEAGPKIGVPERASDGLSVVVGDNALQVGLPLDEHLANARVASDGTVVYVANGEGADLTLQAYDDGSIRLKTVIPDSQSPERYVYSLNLAEGSSIKEQADGGLLVADAAGVLLFAVAPPWAVDAEGNELPTSYEIVGTSIVQWVDLKAAKAFPVVADPYLGFRLIDKVTRSYISGSGYRYFVYPTMWGRTASPIARSYAWAEVKTYYSAINTASLRDQFYCHFDNRTLTAFKGSWNLEAWRPHTNYANLMLKLCNN